MAIKTWVMAFEYIQGKFPNGTIRRSKWSKEMAAIKPTIAAFDPALSLRDDKEEARAGNLDHRFNHWTAVRDALMGNTQIFFRNKSDRQNTAKPHRSNEVL